MHYYPVGLSTGNVLFHQSADASASFRKEEELFESAKEIEAQTIGNLLPDEDDLFSGVFNEVESCADSKGGDNTEDFDLFSSVGGMELEGDDASCAGKRGFDFAGGVFSCCGRSNGSLASTIKIGPSYCADSKHCMMQKCCKLEKDGAGVPKSTNGISSSKCMPGCFSNVSLKGSHSASNVPLNENTLSDRNSCVLNSFPSSLNASSAGNQFGLHIPSHSLDLVKFGSQYISSLESNSFPHCQNNLNAFIPHDSASTVANTAGSRVSERKNGRNISVVGPKGLPMELKGGMIDPFSNATCPVHGHHWSNCYLFPHNSFCHKVWLTSSLLPNGVNAPSSPPKPGCSAFCSGSVGSVGLCGSSPLHLIGRGSPEFSHAGSNCMKSSHGVLHSSRQSSHSKMVTSLPTSFGYPRECWRNISRRNNQGCYIHADKKKFELDIECILRGDDCRTTLMIKNIPNKYTSKMLLATINEHCRGIYDFVYLPIDFKNKCNVGYAFINLIGPLQIIPLYKAFNGKKWEKFNSEKVAAIAYARIQGKAALVAHFQNSSLMNEDKRCRPLLFCTVGPNAGEQEPFPMGTKTRSEAGKPRGGIISEENHLHGSPSMSPNSTESDRGSVSPKSVID